MQLSNEENYTGKVIGLHVSYQTFLRFFANKHMSLSIEDLILAAHFSYGWMPTINKMKDCYPKEALEGINVLVDPSFSFKQNENDIKTYFQKILPLTNNSLVGASKLLHFAKPEVFAIWDSRIYSYFYPGHKMNGLQLKNFDRYFSFHRLLKELSMDEELHDFIERLRIKLRSVLPEYSRTGAEFTDNRCLEFVMYSTAKANKRVQM